jgi:restriction system protein
MARSRPPSEVRWARAWTRPACTPQNDPTMATPRLPTARELLWPTLQVVRQMGGSAANDEIPEAVIALVGFDDAQRSVLHKHGPRTEIEYRLAWARTSLKRVGLLDNSSRGVWSLTPAGQRLLEGDDRDSAGAAAVLALIKQRSVEYRRERRARRTQSVVAETEEDESGIEGAGTWKDELLAVLTRMDPAAFERLSQRLLREAGFVSVTVTGRSGDGGIDGLGVYRVSLLSFPVFFQCKRYQGRVGSSAVRDFRGAMAGRGDKGLLITTGSFTAEARGESTRDGAPPIDLIDGERLCDLLKEYRLGVTSRPVEEVEVDREYFQHV